MIMVVGRQCLKEGTKMTQKDFVELMNMFPDWGSRYEYIMERCAGLYMPEELIIPENKIQSCLAQLYFFVERKPLIKIYACGNNPISLGLAGIISDIFDGIPSAPTYENIYFHTQSGLLSKLSPARAASLIEMLKKLSQ